MSYQVNEILVYVDPLDLKYEVIYLETSEESGNHLVRHLEREIWLRPPQVSGTRRIYEPLQAPERVTSWTMGDPIPDHLIKRKGRK